jgi:pimeloyl-ACP methyl ester carboxylesterase
MSAVHTNAPASLAGRDRTRLLCRLAAGAAALGAAALANHLVARRSEARHPPDGAFLEIDGVRLHYREAGAGPTIVLLHGNGVASDDFVVSGLMERLARSARVIAFDRPGFGHSTRPRRTVWTPAAQAALLRAALLRLDASSPTIVGHSWGTLVAAEMALSDLHGTGGLVLMSGYYHPHPRVDTVLLGAPAAPVIGDVLRYTVSPPVGALITPLILKQIFAPAPVSPRFRGEYPISMSLRPSQLRASAAESALLIPAAARLASRLSKLDIPLLLIAGANDHLLSTSHQTAALARELPRAHFVELEGVGHMVHHSRPDEVASAIQGFMMGKAAAAPLDAFVRLIAN